VKLSRFIGATTRDVLRQVRRALGPDALIVSNRMVDGGVEVVATLDHPSQQREEEAPYTPSSAAPAPDAPSMARIPDAPMPARMMPPPSFEADIHADAQVQAAINALRGSLESRIDGLLWAGTNGSGAEPVKAALFRSLLEAGFSMPVVRALVERVPEGSDRQAALAWARNELVTHLPVLRSEDEFLAGGGVYALVGPTGVGKTTTLAKLAARCVMREGREQVAMLTTDMFRIGAVEQLQIYGRLLGVPAHSVRDTDELKQALASLGNRKFILIDTTGISQRHRNVALQAALLTSADRPVRRLLVLNAASQGDTLDEVAHSYRNGAGDDVAGCIITKLDEATRIASSLDTAIRHRLPIHYVSIGQKVPEDMEVADAQLLVDRALAAPSESSALYAPSEADLASLLRAAGQASGVDAGRRRQMLAAALLPHQPGADARLEKAVEWFDADPACAAARDHWRQTESGDALPAPEVISRTGIELAREAYARSCERYMLAVHGKSSLKGADIPSGTLHATLLMSDRGMALSAPVPQLMLPHGVHAAYAQGTVVPDNAADALAMRVQALHAELAGVPQVHMLEMGTAALWQALTSRGALWVARGTGALKVMQDFTPTILSAVAKEVGYIPAGRMSLTDQDEETVVDLWAGGTEVELPVRGHDNLALRMVSAKLTHPGTGEVLNQLYGLTNIKASQADAGAIARWLLQAEQAKPAFRYMVQAWAAMPMPPGTQSLSRQALYAGQLGAACWQLSNMPQASSARGLLQAMMGGRKLSAPMLPMMLLKCYAMLEMAA
jgi:flagellar biosynthesis protein FlhF